MFIHKRFFIGIGALMVLFVAGFLISGIYYLAITLFFFWMAIFFMDIFSVFYFSAPIKTERIVSEQLSMGDENSVLLKIQNNSKSNLRCKIFDDAPYQLQIRNQSFTRQLSSNSTEEITYFIVPQRRGGYEFSYTNVLIRTYLGLVERKCICGAPISCKVFPSIIQMKKFELKMFHKTRLRGIKKIRRLGHSNEFEQIKYYVQGDDFRKVNWKATSRRREIMINQYQNEQSQHVYTIIDKSRAMRAPIDGLTLLDHSINSSLVFSNTALRKGDKVGLLTYANKIGERIAAERKSSQLQLIMSALYHQKTRFLEANYQLLYSAIRKDIKGRSLIMLYTNFDNISGLKRALPVLKMISKIHLLVVVFFEDIYLLKETQKPAHDLKMIYNKTIAERFIMEKDMMKIEMQKNGIHCVLTKPEELNMDTINKYLEIKSKGLL